MRIDPQVVGWFKQQGRGYQTRINEVLRMYVAAQRAKEGAELARKKAAQRKAPAVRAKRG